MPFNPEIVKGGNLGVARRAIGALKPGARTKVAVIVAQAPACNRASKRGET